MSRKLSSGLFAGFVMMFISMASHLSQGNPLAASKVLALPIPTDNCVECAESYCEDGFHDAWDDDSMIDVWTRNGGAHMTSECWSGTCATKHGPTPCSQADAPTPQVLESLRLAVLNGDELTVAKLARSYPNSISINLDRSAIQLLDCAGSVYLHMPASPSLLQVVKGRLNWLPT